MSQHGKPPMGEQFAGTQYTQSNQQDFAQFVPQVAAEAARAALQAVQESGHYGAGTQELAQQAAMQGAQEGVQTQASGQTGFQPQTQSTLSAVQSPTLTAQQQSRTQTDDRFFPPVDVIETPDEVRVYADLPGVNSQSIQIEALNNTIMLSAERIESGVEGEEGSPVLRERGAVMERTLQIPKPVNLDGAEATWDQGVVTITLPKKEAENKREIGVQ